MMPNIPKGLRLVPAVLAVLALGACSYVKRAEYDATLAQLRANDSALRSDVDGLRADLTALKGSLEARMSQYDARIEQLAGRLSVDMTTHFAFASSEVPEGDRPALDEFASVMREHHPLMVVTVEGFTDSAGSAGYNQRLGQARADAVREYLVSSGGLTADRVRAVSYGEARDRQLQPDAWGEQGQSNRRVTLVVEPDTAALAAVAPMADAG